MLIVLFDNGKFFAVIPSNSPILRPQQDRFIKGIAAVEGLFKLVTVNKFPDEGEVGGRMNGGGHGLSPVDDSTYDDSAGNASSKFPSNFK
jgi:hypothetical protein